MRTRTLAAIAVASLPLLAACGDDGDEVARDAGADPTPQAQGVACEYVEDPMGAAKPVEPPSDRATETGTVATTISTSIGDIPVTLDADRAPCTVHSFLSLAEQGYFDQTDCHRLTTPTAGIAVLQCGDPSASGSGGPGYSFADELHGDESYQTGVLAMANSGPDTNGSQFFLVYDDSTTLDSQPNYTIFGTIDPAGVELIAGAAAQGTASGRPDGAPKVPVSITGVTTS